MKVAISVEGDTLDAKLDSRFGRAKQFLIWDTEKESFEIQDNTQNLNAEQGAGIQAGQNVAASGAEALITGHTGPKAFSVLKAANIAIYYCAGGTAREALEAFKAGNLLRAESADVESHSV